MPLSRRHLLYAMLGALALAAASGVLAIFTTGTDAAWRVAGTALVAAIAAAIMMPMASWADKPATRLAGLTGMAIAVVELLLGSILIWDSALPSAFQELLGWTTAIIGFAGLTAARYLKSLNTPGWKWTARIGAGGCVAAAALFFVAAFESAFGSWSGADPWWSTGIAFSMALLIGSLTLVGLDRADASPWRWAGTAAAVAAFAITSYGIWARTKGDPAWPTAAYALAALVAHTIVCLRVTLPGWQRWVRVAAISATACTAILSVVSAHEEWHDTSFHEFNTIWRITAATGLIAISASLALVVFARLNKRPAIELRKSAFDHVTLYCPRCERRLTVPVGGALCDGCKLHINVTILSTGCAACGYDLSDLHADKCPECGSVIPRAVAGLTETQ